MKVTRQCPVCSKTYQADHNRLKFGRQTTCSRACSYKFRGSKLKRRVVMTCSVCGAKFERSPSQVKSKHEGIYCSRRCHYDGRAVGLTKRIVTKPYKIVAKYDRSEASKRTWRTRIKNGNARHTKATREKLRHKIAVAIASGKFPRVSKIEYIVAEELAKLGIDAIHQYGIRDGKTGRYVACVDFFIPATNTAIEVNGTFWHADPRFYDRDNLTKAQRRTAERYARKLQVLKSQGISLVEIWEYDIAQSPHDAVIEALKVS